MKQILKIGDFNTLFSVQDISNEKTWAMENLNNIINNIEYMVIYQTLHSAMENILSSQIHIKYSQKLSIYQVTKKGPVISINLNSYNYTLITIQNNQKLKEIPHGNKKPSIK